MASNIGDSRFVLLKNDEVGKRNTILKLYGSNIVENLICGEIKFDAKTTSIPNLQETNVSSIDISLTNVTTINSSCFYDSKLQSIKMNYLINSIGQNAFAKTQLTSFSFFSTISSIGQKAFEQCQKFTTIYIQKSDSILNLNADAGIFDDCSSLKTIYVPSNLVASYKNATYWNSFFEKIKPIEKQ